MGVSPVTRVSTTTNNSTAVQIRQEGAHDTPEFDRISTLDPCSQDQALPDAVQVTEAELASHALWKGKIKRAPPQSDRLG